MFAENCFLAGKVVIDAAQCQAGALGNLAYGCGGIALFEEQGIGSFDDRLMGAFTFGE